MKAPVILYALLAVLDQGSTLQCEVCRGVGQNCSGSMETCDPGQDTCGIIKGEEVLGGVKILLYWKSCVTSNVCHNSHFNIFWGNDLRFRRSACCSGEACQTVSLQLPPVNTTPNGLQCPACFSVGSYDCGNEIVHCTGSETHCIDFRGSLHKVRATLKHAVKGCTSVSECKMPRDKIQELLRFPVDFNRLECKPASPAASKAPGWTLLPTLSPPIIAGLILAKTMS